MNLLLADRYGEGRVFLAGDAVHLVIPTGGLGMNTGVGDAIDLSWKLAATLQGWGGPNLLRSYEIERRQIGERNVAASRFATRGRRDLARLYRRTSATTRRRARRLARRARPRRRRRAAQGNEMIGAELGYRYVGSPLICAGAGRGRPSTISWTMFRPPGRARGCRMSGSTTAARCRTASATATATRCCGSAARAPTPGALQRASPPSARHCRCSTLPDAAPRDIYGYDLLLLRPDMHVVWRGNAAAARAGEIGGAGHGALSRR